MNVSPSPAAINSEFENAEYVYVIPGIQPMTGSCEYRDIFPISIIFTNFLTRSAHATSQETLCFTELVNTENNTALPLSVSSPFSITLSNHHSASPVGRAPQFQTCHN